MNGSKRKKTNRLFKLHKIICSVSFVFRSLLIKIKEKLITMNKIWVRYSRQTLAMEKEICKQTLGKWKSVASYPQRLALDYYSHLDRYSS